MGPELNQPNTLGGSCADGTDGTYHVDGSNDRIRVSSVDGTPLRAGKTARVDVTVWAQTGGSDQLALYYAADVGTPGTPDWRPLGIYPAAAPGEQTLSTTYTLPAGAWQAVRARFGPIGPEGPCGGGGLDDHDDLVFAVDTAPLTQRLDIEIVSDENGAGVVQSTPPGLVCQNAVGTYQNCHFDFEPGTTVTLTAVPNAESVFTYWTDATGACMGTGPCVVSLTEPKWVVAHFRGASRLTVTVTSVEGGRGRVDVQPPPLGSVAPVCENPGGAGTVSCSFLYPPGVTVSLAASAEPDSKFWGWEGACSGTAPCEVPPGFAPAVVDARFQGPQSLTVSLASVGDGRGSVMVAPLPLNGAPEECAHPGGPNPTTCTYLYPADTLVTLSASASSDSKFLGWTGPCSDTGLCEVYLNGGPGSSSTSVGASFQGPSSLTLTIEARRGGGGAIHVAPGAIGGAETCALPSGAINHACTLLYPPDSAVTLTPQPTSGSAFVQWGGTCTGAGPCVVTLSESRDVSALFEIPNRAPVAQPGGPQSGVRNQAIVFDGSSSSDADGDPLTYAWDFGDGATATGATPTHAYAALGTYTVALVVNDGMVGSAQATTTVSITNRPPTVKLTAPLGGAIFTAPADVLIAVDASDPDGTIARVELWAGPTKLGEATAHPYTLLWSSVPAGAYSLTALAVDDSGAAVTSSPAAILVNALPSVTLTSPGAGSVFTAPASVTLAATASDPDGTVVAVEFFRDSTSLGVDTASPFTLTWGSVPAGVYALTARATDSLGATVISAPVTVTVNARLAPTADAYVRDGSSYANTNYGLATSLQVRMAATGNNRWTYLTFDTSSLASASRALLRLYGKLSATTGTVVATAVYPVASTSWSESGITWNNKPVAGASALASIKMDKTTTARWYEWDVTAYVQSEKAAGRHIVSLVLKDVATSTPYDTFNSRQAVSNRPELLVAP